MSAKGQMVVIGTGATLVYEMVTSDAYKARNLNPTDNPNVFIAGVDGDPLPLLLILPSTATIFFGGSGVTHTGAGIGAAITGVGSIAYNAVGGDSLYACVASATQTISILALRQ